MKGVSMIFPYRQPRRSLSSRCAVAAALAAAFALGAGAQTPPPGASGNAGPEASTKPDLANQARMGFPDKVTGYMDLTYSVVRGYRPLKLDLYVPAGVAARPAVIWIHGGGWAGGSPRQPLGPYSDWRIVLERLAARGYVVAGATYRLSGEAKFPAAIQDIKTLTRWLRANAAEIGVDPGRIGVWGESAGGQLAALLGTSCGAKELEGLADPSVSSCVQAVADWYGPTDFSQMDSQLIPKGMKHDTPQSAESNYLGCQLSRCAPASMQLANPIAYVSAKTPPFLIMHGDADTAVPPKQSQILYDALRAKGVPAQLIYVPGANHIFAGATKAQYENALDTVFRFFDDKLAKASSTSATH
jgi:acetyl esterase/lipase